MNLNIKKWGCSSVGRASGWHSEGRRFDPVQLHQITNILIFIILFLIAFECLSLDFRKLLIPEEVFKSEQQKRYETQNFKNANISPREWRIKKCYRNVSFEIFWKSKLCPGDIHTCVHSYAVEELQLFKNYRDYLLQISELCADGYVLDKQDRAFFKNSTQGEVDRFIEYVKETRKQEVDYNNLKELDFKSKEKNQEIIKTKNRNEGAHGAVPSPKKMEKESLSEKSVLEEELKLLEEERNLEIRKELLQDEKKILEQKRILRDLEKSIKEAENLIQKKKNSLE